MILIMVRMEVVENEVKLLSRVSTLLISAGMIGIGLVWILSLSIIKVIERLRNGFRTFR
jgi:hypothetical protein